MSGSTAIQIYDHKAIEEKWLGLWKNQKSDSIATLQNDREKLYLLFAFPYPSGSGLHVGHVESKTALDIMARFYRMNGRDVFFPIGWDAFGLPAENYAVKTGVHPRETTAEAIATFKRQIKRIGISYDWEHELNTSDPSYYKWTQWLFLQLYKKGLAYQAMGSVNWCPSCKTVLANEQVLQKTKNQKEKTKNISRTINVCERCDSEVEQKQMKQWYFKITEYQDQLVDDLDQVDWPEATKLQQRNWVGRSSGVEIKFQIPISNSAMQSQTNPNSKKSNYKTVECFTTRVDTVFGVTYLVISPEKFRELKLIELVEESRKEKVSEYISQAFRMTEEDRQIGEKDKTGIDTGLKAVNPVNQEEIVVFVADYVLGGYGTGAVMGVPAHDERDMAFARKHNINVKKVIDWLDELHLLVKKESVDDDFTDILSKNSWYFNEIKPGILGIVVKQENGDKLISVVQKKLKDNSDFARADGSQKVRIYKNKIASQDFSNDDYQFCYSRYGTLVNSGKYDGLSSEEAKKAIVADYKSTMKQVTNYKLRDWLISRQRYWGAPIPIVYDPEGKPHPIKEEHLPWLLPDDVDFKPTGESPLHSSKELKARVEKLYGKGWTPEYDTMDTFVCSSWYYLRYPSSVNQKPETRNPRHAAMAMQKEKQISNQQYNNIAIENEVNKYDGNELPFDLELTQKYLPVDFYMIGPEHIVLHLLYSRFFTKFLRDEGYLDFDEPFMKMRHQGMILGPDHRKMSKSKGNVISPDDIVDKFGADTLRVYEMFMGPIEADKPWDVSAVAGIYRFLTRIHKLMQDVECSLNPESKLQRKLHQTIKKVTQDIPELKFNTAIAELMKFVNAWESHISNVKSQNHNLKVKSLLSRDDLLAFVKILAPFAPFLAEELYSEISESDVMIANLRSIHTQPWPKWDEELAQEEEVIIPIQVNGKVRDQITVSNDKLQMTSEGELLEEAKEQKKVQKWIEGKEILKEIYVPGKIINFVVQN